MSTEPGALEFEEPLLSIRDFRLHFDTFDGEYQVLDGINLTLRKGETLGIVGETGCGKSITAKSILRLVPSPPARVVSGAILYRGRNLLDLTEKEMRGIRGNEISMIFQDPMTYLNPVFSIGQQMVDVILAHRSNHGQQGRMSRKQALDKAIEMLGRVRIPNPEMQIKAYPHQFSGGMRQRVLIAMALSGSPSVLIADEPTTALDVTIQAQILRLITDLVKDFQLSVLMISHDLGVVAKVCRRVAVMYAGNVVEICGIDQIFSKPLHPYTQGLLNAIPLVHSDRGRLLSVPGSIPNLLDPPTGCRFHPRCAQALPHCRTEKPLLRETEPGHEVSCHLFGKD